MISVVKKCVWLSLLICSISCQDSDLQETTRVVHLKPFYSMELHSVFEVYLLQDTTFNITVTGDSEVIGDVLFSIEDSVLTVSNGNKRKWLNPGTSRVKLYVNSNVLSSINIYETCYIKSLDPIISESFIIINQPTPRLCEIDIELDNSYFLYWNNYQCGGRINLRGRTDYLETHTFALMTLDAKYLIADYAFIETRSKGDCEVNVQQQLEYSIHDAGNIYLHGTPDEIILKERTSTGKLIQVN